MCHRIVADVVTLATFVKVTPLQPGESIGARPSFSANSNLTVYIFNFQIMFQELPLKHTGGRFHNNLKHSKYTARLFSTRQRLTFICVLISFNLLVTWWCRISNNYSKQVLTKRRHQKTDSVCFSTSLSI